MKIYTIIVFLILNISVIAQSGTNQKTDKGQKTGRWEELHPNGKIKEVKYYEPAQKIRAPEDAFYKETTSNTDNDLIIYFENICWTEKYEYNKEWDLIRIQRIEPHKQPVYFYGKNKEISTFITDFNVLSKVDEGNIITIELSNHSDHEIVLRPSFFSCNLKTEHHEFVIKPHVSEKFDIQINVEPGEKTCQLNVNNGEGIKIMFSIHTFGYHVESKDIEKGSMLVLPHEFVYYRTGNEALLKIVDNKQEKELKTFSLAHHKTTIRLNEINKNKNWICIIDFSNNNKTCCQFKID